MGNPVTWFEIITDDSAKATSFYSQLFGWTVTADNPMGYGIIDTRSKNGIRGGIVAARHEMPFRGVTFYVEAEDLAACLKKAESIGGKTVLPPMQIPGFGISVAMLRDPGGHTVGLCTPWSK